MRIPYSNFHKIIFQLIDHINSRVDVDKRIELIDYILESPGNIAYINGRRYYGPASSITPANVGWDVPPSYENKTAKDLLGCAIGDLVGGLKHKFEEFEFKKTFNNIIEKYDHLTFREYCRSEKKWPNEVIDFVETVTSQMNCSASASPSSLCRK